ncbi:MAG: hypothetical protein B6I25_05675 [Planctomycetales bacterium 4572_13]|nr:MAG: hypothetical protein B6I25_05675 [Planctomycetales bacterium 4572_13]
MNRLSAYDDFSATTVWSFHIFYSELSVASSKPFQKLTVALAGNPDSGRTTVFDGLTGARHRVAGVFGLMNDN